MRKIYTGIEFSEEACKIVQIDMDNGTVSLHKAIQVSLCTPGENIKDISAQVKAQRITHALKANSIEPKDVVLVIPKNFVKIRVSQLPSIDDEELSQMAQFEAERHILFQAEQHVIDYYIMAKNEIGGSQVLISSVDSNLINPFLEILSAAKIEAQTTTVSSLSLYNDLKYMYPNRINEGPFVVTNIGYEHTDITIIRKGIIAFTRSLTIGISELTKSLQIQLSEGELTTALLNDIDLISNDENISVLAKEWVNKLVNEIARTYEFACREFECPPMKTLILTGTGSYIKNIVKKFEESFNIPVEMIDPIQSMQCPRELEGVKNNSSRNYSILIGGLLPCIIKDLVYVNITPKEYLVNVGKKRRNKSLTVSGILLLAAVVLSIVWMQQMSILKTNLLNYYDEQNKKVKPIVDDIKDKKIKLKIMEDYVEDKYSALVILNEISKYTDLLPEKVSITNFEYKKNQIVSIDGWAVSIAELNKFENNLKTSGIFENIQVINRTFEDFKNRGSFFNFKLECSFKKEIETKKNIE